MSNILSFYRWIHSVASSVVHRRITNVPIAFPIKIPKFKSNIHLSSLVYATHCHVDENQSYVQWMKHVKSRSDDRMKGLLQSTCSKIKTAISRCFQWPNMLNTVASNGLVCNHSLDALKLSLLQSIIAQKSFLNHQWQILTAIQWTKQNKIIFSNLLPLKSKLFIKNQNVCRHLACKNQNVFSDECSIVQNV